MDLGPAFLEHVAGLRMHGGPVAVAKLTSALYFYTDQDYLRDVDPPEMLALLQATSALVRRCDPYQTAATPYTLTSVLYSYTDQDFICIIDLLRCWPSCKPLLRVYEGTKNSSPLGSVERC